MGYIDEVQKVFYQLFTGTNTDKSLKLFQEGLNLALNGKYKKAKKILQN